MTKPTAPTRPEDIDDAASDARRRQRRGQLRQPDHTRPTDVPHLRGTRPEEDRMAPAVGVMSAEWDTEDIERELATLTPKTPQEQAALDRIGKLVRRLGAELTDVQLNDSDAVDPDHRVWHSELERLDDALSGPNDRAIAGVVRSITRRLGDPDWQLDLLRAGVLAHLRCYPADPGGLPDPGWQIDVLDAATRGDLYQITETQIALERPGDGFEDVTGHAAAMAMVGLLERDAASPDRLRPTAAGDARLAELTASPARRSWWARILRAARRG